MAVSFDPIKLTYEDYRHLSDDKSRELIDGGFCMTPSPTKKHQQVSRRIGFCLCQWVEAKELGEVFYAPLDVVLSEYDVVQPDIMFISKEHEKIAQENGVFGAPDLVIEIISPGTAERDKVTKKHLYSKHGVREYWIVDPNLQTIALFAFEKNQLELKQTYPLGSVLESLVISGFSLDTTETFK